MDNRLRYFIDLLIVTCDPPKEPLTISEVVSFEASRLGNLGDVISIAKVDFDSRNWNCGGIPGLDFGGGGAVGLNTIGMLVDRLSILIIKKTIHKSGADQTLSRQIDEMVWAIENCKTGFSSTFNKITNSQSENELAHVIDIALLLAFVNLLLWMAQDVLYLRGAGSLANEELRAYIDYFAKKNIIRNQLISRLALYWHI